MPKTQTIFACEKCGAQTPKWQGRCLSCGAWGTLKEEIIGQPAAAPKLAVPADRPLDLTALKSAAHSRTPTGLTEIDRVLGGGIVRGGFMLLGGDPGIGKSTLALQLAGKIGEILYVSGEESAEQVKMRAERLDIDLAQLKFLPQTDTDKIIATAREYSPRLLIIDSIQTIHTAEATGGAGSVAQITACAAKLMELAKATGIAVLLIGHVTKDGLVAGPKTLEHLVDTVIYLENDAQNYYKILRAVKNRFGSIGEIGILEMTAGGLKEISNPTQIFIDKEIDANHSGIATTMILEGSRPFLVEIQTLAAKTFFGYPQRRATGFDLNRLQILLAVISKYAKINLSDKDVYLNIAGGLKIKDTAGDLAVILALASAQSNKPIGNKTLILGEVGLSGEVRSLPQLERRIKEAEKLGYERFIVPQNQLAKKPQILAVKTIAEAIELI